LTSYEWQSPGATALVVPFRAAEPLIGEHRRAHTPSGREGMPAHATLLAPFVHSSRLDSSDRRRIRGTIRRFTAFDVRLGSFGCFEHIGCLYLEPEPSKPFVAMSEALLELYPEIEFPPGGATEIVPHVTVGGYLTTEQQEEIKSELALHLPIRARAECAVLYERGEDGRWFSCESFALS
jgi:2'-5' RNA ligase